MSDAYLGEIRMFAGNYPPEKWAFCDGQALNKIEHSKLFELIGYTYGGNGWVFQLPNLMGKAQIHRGKGEGLSNYTIGQCFGNKEVTLTPQDFPRHNHLLNAATRTKDLTQDPKDNTFSNVEFNLYNENPTGESMVEMWEGSIDSYGEKNVIPHSNMQPYLCVSFIICLDGAFPSRS